MTDIAAPPPLNCWVITDGRRGIENQAVGLAEAISRLRPLTINKRVMDAGPAFKAASPKMQLTMRSNLAHYGLFPPYPSLAIGCGRQAIAPLMALKKTVQSVFTVYIQDPRIASSNFDCVVAPKHDGAKGDNVLEMIGSPNRITKTELIANVLSFNAILEDLPMPRVAMLIGGTSKSHNLDQDSHAQHIGFAKKIIETGRSLMISTSRRTPSWAVDDYKKFASQNSDVWFYDGADSNPYFAFLGAANTILVTEDSTNMLTEACATGKPVFTLPMDGKPGKFKALYKSLADQCYVEPFKMKFDRPDYPPLNETARIAPLVLQKFSL